MRKEQRLVLSIPRKSSNGIGPEVTRRKRMNRRLFKRGPNSQAVHVLRTSDILQRSGDTEPEREVFHEVSNKLTNGRRRNEQIGQWVTMPSRKVRFSSQKHPFPES